MVEREETTIIPQLSQLTERAVEVFEGQEVFENDSGKAEPFCSFHAAQRVVDDLVERGVPSTELFTSLLNQTAAQPADLPSYEGLVYEEWDDLFGSLSEDILAFEMNRINPDLAEEEARRDKIASTKNRSMLLF